MPAMRNVLSALALVTSMTTGHAATADCLIQVRGKTYVQGPCPIYMNGSTVIVGSDGERRASPYFAYIDANPDGSADGRWNETPGSTHAQTGLGTLKRDGFCWLNATAKICAK